MPHCLRGYEVTIIGCGRACRSSLKLRDDVFYVAAAALGALAGALHGASWLPQRWLQDLENEPGAEASTAAAGETANAENEPDANEEGEEEEGDVEQGSEAGDAFSLAACGVGRDAVAGLARQLATLHCQAVPNIMQGLRQ